MEEETKSSEENIAEIEAVNTVEETPSVELTAEEVLADAQKARA